MYDRIKFLVTFVQIITMAIVFDLVMWHPHNPGLFGFSIALIVVSFISFIMSFRKTLTVIWNFIVWRWFTK